MSHGKQGDEAAASIRPNIVGTWELLSFKITVHGKTIYPMGETPKGIHIFTASHDMTASILNPGQAPYPGGNPFTATDDELAEAGRRFMGWAGKWTVSPLHQDDLKSEQMAAILVYEVQVVNYPNQLGKTQERKVWLEDDDKVLVVTSLDGHEPLLEYRWVRTA